MKCSTCDGLVICKGPLSNLTHTECSRCGAINNQVLDEPEEVACSGGCGSLGEPNYDDKYFCYFSGGSPSCCP